MNRRTGWIVVVTCAILLGVGSSWGEELGDQPSTMFVGDPVAGEQSRMQAQPNAAGFETIACTYTIVPTNYYLSAIGTAATISVYTSPSTCKWTAISMDAWIAIDGNPSGTGNGVVNFVVGSNASPDPRTGRITIAEETLWVYQDGAACALSISPAEVAVNAAGGSGSVSVATATGCDWEATSNATWITITGGFVGSGSGTIFYDVAAHSSPNPRRGTMNVADSTFTVTQGTGVFFVNGFESGDTGAWSGFVSGYAP